MDSELSLMLAKKQIHEWIEEAARIRAAKAATGSGGRKAPATLDIVRRRRWTLPAWLMTLLFWSSP